MKKVILVLIVFFTITSIYSQIELKGFKLGELYEGEEVNLTTLGGVEGAIIVSKIKDSRIYSLMFTPSSDGRKISRISSSDAERLENGIRKKYDIKLKRTNKDSYSSDDYWLRGNKDGIDFLISVDYNKYSTPSTEFVFYMTNKELEKINKKEEQEKANEDF